MLFELEWGREMMGKGERLVGFEGLAQRGAIGAPFVECLYSNDGKGRFFPCSRQAGIIFIFF